MTRQAVRLFGKVPSRLTQGKDDIFLPNRLLGHVDFLITSQDNEQDWEL
jgi:hypothetical protein